MIVLMQTASTGEQVAAVVELVKARGMRALELPGGGQTAIGIASAIPADVREELAESLRVLPGVANVVHVSRPYKLASREFHGAQSTVRVGSVEFGARRCVLIAGPCAVESREQITETAREAAAHGAAMLRGGAFKPRSSPYAFQGLQDEGLDLLQAAGCEVGLPVVTEVMDPSDVDRVAAKADMLQLGARNMQNYPLLVAVGRSGHPVLLKRGPSATLDEFLLAAEYVLNQGNANVVLCERGVHPLDRTYTRNTLDLNAVPVLKELSHLPVVVDPSHGIGQARFVPAMALAAVAAGADGVMVEVHPNPRKALSDGQQSLTPDEFGALARSLARVAEAVGRSL